MLRMYSAIILTVGALMSVTTVIPQIPSEHFGVIEERILGPATVEEVIPTPKPKPKKSYIEKAIGYSPSKKEIDLLERLVYCEAGNQSLDCKVAVVNVVLNRVKSKEFPNTISEVIKQSRQFSPVGSGWINTVTATEDSKKAVQLAFKGKKVVSDSTHYFFATWLDKNHLMWKQTKITKTIGKVAFGERK